MLLYTANTTDETDLSVSGYFFNCVQNKAKTTQTFLVNVLTSLLSQSCFHLASEVVIITYIQIHIKGFSVAVAIRGEHVFVEGPVYANG